MIIHCSEWAESSVMYANQAFGESVLPCNKKITAQASKVSHLHILEGG